jgi:hypothetical protein
MAWLTGRYCQLLIGAYFADVLLIVCRCDLSAGAAGQLHGRYDVSMIFQFPIFSSFFQDSIVLRADITMI